MKSMYVKLLETSVSILLNKMMRKWCEVVKMIGAHICVNDGYMETKRIEKKFEKSIFQLNKDCLKKTISP